MFSHINYHLYDVNGDLIKDLNKNLVSIQYNYLNLPDTVIVNKKHCIYYRYGGEGSKFQVIHKDSIENVTDYCGNVLYDNNVLHKVLTEEGFVTFENGVPVYHYFLQDHQGNNRMVIRQDGIKEEVNHYYPFGGLFGESTGMQKQAYKYNGKELDTNIGLNWYDYGARHYDAALGRWNAVDPMAEKYYGISPYGYCANNPVKNIDPDGRTIVIWYNNNRSSYTYSGGNVTHSNPFVRSVVTAYQYNKANGIKAGNGGGASTVAIVENTGIKVNVTEATLRDQYSPDASHGTIYWNSEWGSQNDNGTVRSPATIFDHEADHALEHKTNPEAYEVNRVKDSDLQYDTKEERRVITGSEQKTARANGDTRPGQVTRRNHYGRTVITKGVTSNVIDKQKTQVYEKRKKPTWTSELEQ
ncbi:RHS repeat-associated core domain-containing protein [Bacteroides sp. GM023]|nr:RHS repeat-associated core domain-containing protein [Bacteroides sp. GM023]